MLFEVDTSVWLWESTGTLLEKRAAAAAVYHPDLLGKEEYALRAQASIPLRTKRPPDNQKLPAPLTTRAGRADQDGHPGKVKARGGGGRSEEGMGAGIITKALNTSSDELFIFDKD